MSVVDVGAIVNKYGRDPAALLAILQDIQEEANYLPREALDDVTRLLGVPESRVYGMATFFKALSLKERGRHVCQVCTGTACHVRGADGIVEEFSRKLGIEVGGVTEDREFSLETVNCVGACALAPVVVIDKKYHGGTTTEGVKDLLGSYGYSK